MCKCPCAFTSTVHTFINHFITFFDQIKVRLGQARALPGHCLLNIHSQLKLLRKHEPVLCHSEQSAMSLNVNDSVIGHAKIGYSVNLIQNTPQ